MSEVPIYIQLISAVVSSLIMCVGMTSFLVILRPNLASKWIVVLASIVAMIPYFAIFSQNYVGILECQEVVAEFAAQGRSIYIDCNLPEYLAIFILGAPPIGFCVSIIVAKFAFRKFQNK